MIKKDRLSNYSSQGFLASVYAWGQWKEERDTKEAFQLTLDIFKQKYY